MAKSVGLLNIDLIANTARFIEGLTKANRSLKLFQNIVTRTFKAVKNTFKSAVSSIFSLKGAIGGFVAGGGLLLLTKRTLENIDAVGKMSKTYGIATKDIATFQLAAALGGSSLQTFAKAARQVSKSVFDFVKRGTGEASDAFKELGITQVDLLPIMNDQVAIISLIGERLNNLEDGAVKTALAYKLFGGRATELLPALAGGKNGIAAVAKEAEQLGIALSQETVKGVEKANDAVTRLKFLFTGFIQNTVAKLAPALELAVTRLKDFILQQAKAAGGIPNLAKNAAKAILNAIKSMLQGFQSVVNGIGYIKNAFSLFIKLFKEVGKIILAPILTPLKLLEGGFKLVENNITSLKEKAKSTFSAIANSITTIFPLLKATEHAVKAVGKSSDELNVIDQIFAKFKTSVNEDNDALQSSINFVNDLIKAVETLDTTAKGATKKTAENTSKAAQEIADAVAAGTAFEGPTQTIDLDYLQKQLDAGVLEGPVMPDYIGDLRAQMNDRAQILRDSFANEAIVIQENLEKRLEQARQNYEAGNVDYNTYWQYRIAIAAEAEDKIAAYKKKKAAEEIKTMATLANDAASIFGSLASLVGGSTKSSFELQKKLQRASVIMSTAAGIMQAYAQGGILGAAAAAAIALKGAASLAQINRTTFGGGGGGLANAAGGLAGGVQPGATAPGIPNIANNEPIGGDINITVNGSVVGADLEEIVSNALRNADRRDLVNIRVEGVRAEVA